MTWTTRTLRRLIRRSRSRAKAERKGISRSGLSWTFEFVNILISIMMQYF